MCVYVRFNQLMTDSWILLFLWPKYTYAQAHCVCVCIHTCIYTHVHHAHIHANVYSDYVDILIAHIYTQVAKFSYIGTQILNILPPSGTVNAGSDPLVLTVSIANLPRTIGVNQQSKSAWSNNSNTSISVNSTGAVLNTNSPSLSPSGGSYNGTTSSGQNVSRTGMEGIFVRDLTTEDIVVVFGGRNCTLMEVTTTPIAAGYQTSLRFLAPILPANMAPQVRIHSCMFTCRYWSEKMPPSV